MRRLPLALLLGLALAGCVTQGQDPPPDEAEAPTVEASAEDAPPMGTPEPPPSERVVPIALNGSTSTSAGGCVESECQGFAPTVGESDIVLVGERGVIVGGALTLAWTASSPATERLSFGAMVMGGEGEACPSTTLGEARGASPLALDVAALERGLCPNEVFHVWVAGDAWGAQGPLYYQVDVSQDFALSGQLRLSPGELH